MSAANSIFKVGQGAKSLAIAAAIGLGIVGVVWLVRNREKFDPTSDKNIAYQGSSSVARAIAGTVSDNVRPEDTLGTLAYDGVQSVRDFLGLNKIPNQIEAQELQICRAAYARDGKVTVPRCVDLLTKYGAS